MNLQFDKDLRIYNNKYNSLSFLEHLSKDMLINKKSKPIEDKNKIKQTESGFKKAKKNKIASPSKTKGTP